MISPHLSGIDRLQWPVLPAAELRRREGRAEEGRGEGKCQRISRKAGETAVAKRRDPAKIKKKKKKKNSLAETTKHNARQRGKNAAGAKRGPPNTPQVQNADGYMILGRNI